MGLVGGSGELRGGDDLAPVVVEIGLERRDRTRPRVDVAVDRARGSRRRRPGAGTGRVEAVQQRLGQVDEVALRIVQAAVAIPLGLDDLPRPADPVASSCGDRRVELGDLEGERVQSRRVGGAGEARRGMRRQRRRVLLDQVDDDVAGA